MLRGQPFAWVLRGVYIGLPPGGTMVTRGLSQSAKSVAGPQKPATPFLEAGAPLRRQDEVRLQ